MKNISHIKKSLKAQQFFFLTQSFNNEMQKTGNHSNKFVVHVFGN